MKIRDILSYSFGAIKLRKLRAGLTTLGVIIGITALVALLSVTQGLQVSVENQLVRGLSTDTLIVTAGGGGMLGLGADGESGATILHVSDASNFSSSMSPSIVYSFAVIQQPGRIFYSDGTNRTVTIVGVDFDKYKAVYPTSFVASSGTISSNPTNNDVVLGARISDPGLNGTVVKASVNDNVTLFWLNSTIPMNQNATVTAVVNKVGSGLSLGGPSDTYVYIPINQAEKLFGDVASSIIVKLNTSDKATIESVTKTITSSTYYGNQVSVFSAVAALNLVSSIFSTIQLFLGGITGISLLVAGVGIMNIMIVSLIERTREIGILKALGMKSKTVLSIFLVEAVLIGLIGSIVGIFAGIGVANVAIAVVMRGSALTITPVLTSTVLLAALGFGIGVSVAFSLYPAWRASKLKPVDALRYE